MIRLVVASDGITLLNQPPCWVGLSRADLYVVACMVPNPSIKFLASGSSYL
jgi:hypothetical protein